MNLLRWQEEASDSNPQTRLSQPRLVRDSRYLHAGYSKMKDVLPRNRLSTEDLRLPQTRRRRNFPLDGTILDSRFRRRALDAPDADLVVVGVGHDDPTEVALHEARLLRRHRVWKCP